MNLTDGGQSTVFSKDTRLKISKNKTGIKRSDITKKRLSASKKGKISHINFRYSPKEYEIYDSKNILKYKFKSNVKNMLKELNLPSYSFCKSYNTNTKINKGLYKDWYMVRL